MTELKSNIYRLITEYDMDDLLIKIKDEILIVLYLKKSDQSYTITKKHFVDVSKILTNHLFLLIDVDEFKHIEGKYKREVDISRVEFFYNKASIAYLPNFNKSDLVESLYKIKGILEKKKQEVLEIMEKNQNQNHNQNHEQIQQKTEKNTSDKNDKLEQEKQTTNVNTINDDDAINDNNDNNNEKQENKEVENSELYDNLKKIYALQQLQIQKLKEEHENNGINNE